MILITGAAGFIGYHLIHALMESGTSEEIIAIDNFNSYYNPALKRARCSILEEKYGIRVADIDICDNEKIKDVFRNSINIVVHLAAQAGVRYSIENPRQYISSNIDGFTNIIEAVRQKGIEHFIYASSSSIYGNESEVPFREDSPFHNVESLYAVTKVTNEMMADVYSRLYSLNVTGLRFFTVYGSWGRPDMAYYSFAEAIRKQRPIQVFNNGNLERDFTHVSDIVSGIKKIVEQGPGNRQEGRSAVYNIGRGNPVRLMEFISTIEDALGMKAEKILVPMQPGDVNSTWADVSAIRRDYGYEPVMDLKDGIREFIEWYRGYHEV